MGNRIFVGCMRFGDFLTQDMNSFIHQAQEIGITNYDHADIYAGGKSEKVFGNAFSSDKSLTGRAPIIITTAVMPLTMRLDALLFINFCKYLFICIFS